MFANAKALVVIVSCALVAHAQSSFSGSPTGTASASQSSVSSGSIPPCVLSCVTQAAASGGCLGITDVNCLCSSSNFQTAAQSCLLANCTASDQQAAVQLEQQQCAAVSGSSGPVSTAASTAAKTGTTASASATHSATSSSAAMALSAPFSLGSLVGTLVASAGALVGAAFVL